MNLSRSTFALALFVPLLTCTAFPAGTSPRRIHFQRGTSSATVGGRLSKAHLEDLFVFGARAGQTLTLRVSAESNSGLNGVNVIVSGPSQRGVVIDGQDVRTVPLAATGDYHIDVSPLGIIYRGSNKLYVRFTIFLSIK